jgi:hypothetical protein
LVDQIDSINPVVFLTGRVRICQLSISIVACELK